MQWLVQKGATVYVPIGHSPDVDLVAVVDRRTFRVEVKTATSRDRDRWSVGISTRGGNQSWSGLVKYFDPERCEFLFVHVGDGRRWFIPTAALDWVSQPHARRAEVLRVRDRAWGAAGAVSERVLPRIRSRFGGVPKRSNGMRCKRIGSVLRRFESCLPHRRFDRSGPAHEVRARGHSRSTTREADYRQQKRAAPGGGAARFGHSSEKADGPPGGTGGPSWLGRVAQGVPVEGYRNRDRNPLKPNLPPPTHA